MSGVILSRSLTSSRRFGGQALLRALAVAFRAISTRRELAEMDDRMLRDIGISRAEALAEASRAPWDTEGRR